MSINPESQYPTKVAAATAEYPYGSARNITVTGDGTGTPWEAALVNDIFGFQQALLKSGGIVPSGTPDEVGASQYLQSLIELASGRAINYDESGLVNAYVLDARTDLEAPASYFDGMRVEFTPSLPNAGGASTVDVAGLGVKGLVTYNNKPLPANYLNGSKVVATYNLTSGNFRLDPPVGGDYIKLSETQPSGTAGGTFTAAAWQTRLLNTKDNDAESNCVLAANQFTLVAGTYQVDAIAVAYQVSEHKCRIYNVSDAITEVSGSSIRNSGDAGKSSLIGEFTITASKIFELQHYCSVTVASNGFGVATSTGLSEVYSMVELRKVK